MRVQSKCAYRSSSLFFLIACDISKPHAPSTYFKTWYSCLSLSSAGGGCCEGAQVLPVAGPFYSRCGSEPRSSAGRGASHFTLGSQAVVARREQYPLYGAPCVYTRRVYRRAK